MDYVSHLKELLHPLGIYDVDTGAGAAELTAVGNALNVVWSALETAQQESSPVTALSAGLTAWEALLPFHPAWRTTAQRQAAVCALLRIDSGSFTPAALNGTLAGCGIRAVAEETATAMTVRVSFPDDRGVPEGFETLSRHIEEILPCHLAVEYFFLFVTWVQMETLFATWADTEADGLMWKEIERLGGESA